jgi:WD40 repeat protein
MDEITAALSISFNSTGTKLFAGYNKAIRVFDVHRPGRDFEQHSLLKGCEGPTGIISSISFSPHNGMLAVGSYSQTTAVYAESNMEPLYVLHGQLGGVTQVLFSKDGNYLYTGGRKVTNTRVLLTIDLLRLALHSSIPLCYEIYLPNYF